MDTTTANTARVWNYWLGGKDNYPVDEVVGDQIAAAMPQIVDLARAVREFLVRAVTYLVAEAGIRQFLDIGTGYPPPTTPTRLLSEPTRGVGSSTWTTTL